MSDSLQPHGLQPTRFLCPWDFPGKNTGVGCHFLLQAFPNTCLFFLFLKFIFNLRKIALQCCVGFCCTTARISHDYTCISSLLSLPSHAHPTPPGHHRVWGWTSGFMYKSSFPPAVYFTQGPVYMSMLLSPSVPPSPCPVCVHRSIPYICVSILSLKIGSWHHFSRFIYTS